VRGRVEDLGGQVRVTSAPGAGTEVELRVPRR
jgi:signal transduction histidine kinase